MFSNWNASNENSVTYFQMILCRWLQYSSQVSNSYNMGSLHMTVFPTSWINVLPAQEIWLLRAMHSSSCRLKLVIFDNDNKITAWKDKFLEHPVKWKGWTENGRLENPFSMSQTKTTGSFNLTKGRLPVKLALIEQLLELWQTKYKKNQQHQQALWNERKSLFRFAIKFYLIILDSILGTSLKWKKPKNFLIIGLRVFFSLILSAIRERGLD